VTTRALDCQPGFFQPPYLAEIFSWCEEHARGEWSVFTAIDYLRTRRSQVTWARAVRFNFADPVDLIHFTLRWGDFLMPPETE